MKKRYKKEINYMDLDSMVLEMKKYDGQYKKVSRAFQIVFFIFIFLYAALFLFNPNSEMTIYHRIAGGCYVVAFILFTLIFRKNYKKYRDVNYSDPVKKVLEDAERRYRLWRKDIASTSIAIICIDAATVLIVMQSFIEKWPFWSIFFIIQLVYFTFILIGFTIGYIKWKKEFRPIWLSAKKLLKELEE